VHVPQRPTPSGREPTNAVRAICLAIPDATERLSHGEAAWFVRDKRQFATMSDHHHDDRVAVWCAAPMGATDTLVTARPDRYFVPPYVGTRGWLGIWLDGSVDWDEVAALLRDAFRTVAEKTPAPRARPR
jgi:hypothetical protein